MIRQVAVGISGGVDSAVAALLLKQSGFRVRGVFMKNWDLIDEHGACPGEADLADAAWVCRKLDIPLTVVNFVKEYWNNVFGHFLHDYETGLTPNPDILCNKHIKFDAFYRHCREHLQADAIATGHYARSSFGRFLEAARTDAPARLLCAADTHKDQTFFLSQMPQLALQHTMFPLGDLCKPDVKRLAAAAGLDRIARKRESTGICFVGKRNFTAFIGDYLANRPGPFQRHDTGALCAVQHDGLHHWTVGQRSRLEGDARPLFVLRKCAQTNTIFVVPGTEHRALRTDLMYAEGASWIAGDPFRRDDGGGGGNAETAVLQCRFRFQHTKPLVECSVVRTSSAAVGGGGGLLIRLAEPLRAITPGQFAVFYRGEECLGSARITAPGPSLEYRAERVENEIKASRTVCTN